MDVIAALFIVVKLVNNQLFFSRWMDIQSGMSGQWDIYYSALKRNEL